MPELGVLKTFVVGGAVRDELLGLAVQDRDYVVVGATPEEMAAAGFKPVGRDFPVFLHPETYEEYALARTERKSGRGYKGFTVYSAPDVTLEQDLARRDLTINAIARASDGTLVDPARRATSSPSASGGSSPKASPSRIRIACSKRSSSAACARDCCSFSISRPAR